MDTGDIITAFISFVALSISGLTAYLTLLSRFKANISPKRRAILTQIDGNPCIILNLEFINDGSEAFNRRRYSAKSKQTIRFY